MSNQESMFADQDQTDKRQAYRPQPINNGSYGQASSQMPGKATPLQDKYDQGYVAQDARDEQLQTPPQDEYLQSYSELEAPRWYDGKIRPQQQPAKARNMYWLWVPVLVLVFIFALATGVTHNAPEPAYTSAPPVMSIPQPNQGIPQPPQTFSVGDHPLLQINVGTANVHIITSTENIVSVTANGVNSDQIFSSLTDNTVSVAGPDGSGVRGEGDDTTLAITVPANSDIDLHSTSGQVNINGVSGQVKINVQDGEVNLSQMMLRGESNIYSANGSIHFNGSLDLNGTYRMSTDNGDIDVTLPPNAAFHLTKGSNVSINEFGPQSRESDPNPSLTLHSDNGQVSVHKGI